MRGIQLQHSKSMSYMLIALSFIYLTACTYVQPEDESSFYKQTIFSGPSSNDTNEKKYHIITRMTRRCNFNIEKYNVKTQDGYYMNIYKIFSKNLSEGVTPKENPVLLMHGLYSSSTTWILNGCERSVPYHLARQGYTVWLGNVRGNSQGRRHATLNYSDPKFWNFSWYDHALSDLPAIVKYVYKNSNERQLYYMGHSQGTLILLTWGSHPENNAAEYIKKFLAVAPIYKVTTTSTFTAFLASNSELHKPFSSIDTSMLYKYSIQAGLILCRQLKFFECKKLLGLIEYEEDEVAQETLFRFLKNCKDKTSAKNLIHFLQMIATGETRAFDYGEKENLARYKSKQPPLIEVKNFKIPTALYYAGRDSSATPENVRALGDLLPNVVGDHYYEEFSHSSFLLGAVENSTFLGDVMKEMSGSQ